MRIFTNRPYNELEWLNSHELKLHIRSLYAARILDRSAIERATAEAYRRGYTVDVYPEYVKFRRLEKTA